MSGRTDTGRTVDVHAEVAAAFNARLPGVQAHPHAQRDTFRPGMPGQQPLGGNRRRRPVFRPLKDGKELIGSALDLVATRLRHRLAD